MKQIFFSTSSSVPLFCLPHQGKDPLLERSVNCSVPSVQADSLRLLLIFQLDELVELDVNTAVLEVLRKIIGRHHRNDRRQGILRTACRGHDRGASPQKGRTEEQDKRSPSHPPCETSFLTGCSHSLFRYRHPAPKGPFFIVSVRCNPLTNYPVCSAPAS